MQDGLRIGFRVSAPAFGRFRGRQKKSICGRTAGFEQRPPAGPLLPPACASAKRRARPASAFEALFRLNDWPPEWRDGVYGYHHYHSTAHEALGFAAGRAKLALGGPGGIEVDVAARDVVVLPAGTGHCRFEASPDFLVVGAYPPVPRWDLRRAAPTAEEARALVAAGSCLHPVAGASGPLVSRWREAGLRQARATPRPASSKKS